MSFPIGSSTPVHFAVVYDAWLGTLASPWLGDVIAAADVSADNADTDVESRSSTDLPAPTVQGPVVPDAPRDDTSATRPIVDAACASPASVPPTASPDEPRATGPAVPIAPASDDQPTLELSKVLARASSPAPPAPLGLSVAVDPTPADDVPPAAPATPVELSRPVPMLSAAWSARLDDGMEPETEAVAVVVMSVASQLAVDARAALVGEVEGAAEAQSLAVRMSSAGSALAGMDCWCGVAETGRSVLIAVCVEWLPSIGRRAELEPELTEDVGASCPVSVPTMPVSAGCVVGDEGVDAEVELAVASSAAVRSLAVLDAAGTATRPAEVADKGAASSSSKATVELV